MPIAEILYASISPSSLSPAISMIGLHVILFTHTLTHTHKHAHWLHFLEFPAFSTFQKCDYIGYLLLDSKPLPNWATKTENICVYTGFEDGCPGRTWLVGPNSGSLMRQRSSYEQGQSHLRAWLQLEGLQPS